MRWTLLQRGPDRNPDTVLVALFVAMWCSAIVAVLLLD